MRGRPTYWAATGRKKHHIPARDAALRERHGGDEQTPGYGPYTVTFPLPELVLAVPCT